MAKAGAAASSLHQMSLPFFSLRSFSPVLFFVPGGRANVAAAELRRFIPALHPPLRPPLLSSRRGPPRAFRFPVSASRRRRPRGKKESSEDDEGEDAWEDDAGDEEEEAEEEGDLSGEPLEEMRRWLENKPAGFGEGKTYDTLLEDELWEEMERSRKAQAANLNKLKNERNSNKKSPNKISEDRLAKKQQQKQDAIASGARVRIWNLPKKKNIHRDLNSAFKGFPGLVSISPAVTGNEKTRDPICKGFAFVDLNSEVAAYRFVQEYSKKPLVFGKVQKLIDCGIINRRDCSEPPESFAVLGKKEEKPDENKEISSADFQQRESFDEQTSIHILDDSFDGSKIEMVNEVSFDHVDSWQKQKKRGASKKKAVKRIPVKPSNSNLPGSAVRLKTKERGVLTGVFSKYGGNGAPDN